MKNKPEPKPKRLLRPDEVAEYFSVARSTVYLWCEHGHLEKTKLTNGTLRITAESVEAFEKRGFTKAANQ